MVALDAEGELVRLHADHVFLDVVTFAIFDILMVLIHLVSKVTLDNRVIVEANRLVFELHAIFDALEHHEQCGTGDSDTHVDLEMPPFTHFQGSPCEHHRHGRTNKDKRVDQTRQHRQRPLRPRVVGSQAEINIGGEEATEEHDLGGEEQPDGNLGVDQARVLTGGYDIWDFHF